MRILSLNTWHGECKPALRAFLLSQLETVDVFCLQEASGDAIEEIITALFAGPEFQIAIATKDGYVSDGYCVYIIAKKPITLLSGLPLLDDGDPDTGLALAAKLQVDSEHLVIVSVHGMPYPGDKLDSEGRLRQTRQLLEWLGDQPIPAIVCGDFNLDPATKSVQRFAAAGYRDLVKEYQIATTRNRLAWEKWPNNMQLYADYTFVSPGVTVTDFRVPAMEVSDHLPMIIDVNLLEQ